MLTVICGEDITASRQYFSSLKEQYEKKNFELRNIVPSDLEEIYKNSEGVISLFGQQNAYYVDKLSTFISRKKKSTFEAMFKELVANKDIHIIDWEEKSAYELTSIKKHASDFKEFKPEKSIFQLMDTCYPNNLKGFLKSVDTVHQTQDDTFIFAMLCKHVRTLILAKENALGNMPPWQKKNVLTQAKMWNMDKLIGFYEGLAKIDMSLKTSGTPFTVKKSLDILSCYYL